MKAALVIMAAGMGSRYGGEKQTDGIGPHGEAIMEYSVYDAVRAGFHKIVFIIKPEMEEAFRATVGQRISGTLEVRYAFQKLDLLPAGYQIPEGRVKPWGTGMPALVISARFAPLPPRISRMSLLPSLNRYRYFFLLKFLYLQNCTSGTPHPAAKRALVCQNFSAFPLEKYGKGHGQLYYIRVVFPFPQQKAENLGIFPVFFIYAHACACKMRVFRYNKKGPGMCRAPIKP